MGSGVRVRLGKLGSKALKFISQKKHVKRMITGTTAATTDLRVLANRMKDLKHETLVLEGRILRLENTKEDVADEDLRW